MNVIFPRSKGITLKEAIALLENAQEVLVNTNEVILAKFQHLEEEGNGKPQQIPNEK